MSGTCHIDTFVLDNMPPAELMPDFINLDRLGYPERLNAAAELVDRNVAEGRGDRPALVAPGGVRWTYADLARTIDKMANALTGKLGLVPGNRILLRSANNPTKVALYMAIIKAGGIVVATMPLLRSRELVQVLDKAKIGLALCDATLAEEMEKAAGAAAERPRIVTWSGTAGGELGALLEGSAETFDAAPSRGDDPCLLGFTSGTTGLPKATIHTHRDLLVICDCYSREVLRPNEDDIFIGSPPLAFTFGLGGLVLFPFRVGASAVLLEKAGPPDLAKAIGEYKATISFTAPTAYRAILAKADEYDLSSLRKCVSAGETLPKPTFDAWYEKTGIRLMDGIGATEMLHIFIAAREDEIRPGSTGKPVPGYEAKVIDGEGNELPRGTPGRLAVRGPIGCRYLADERQAVYVEKGWNVTGDTYVEDEDGYFWFQARNDDMIVSAGYNIAGPEVEAALLAHPDVMEAGVVGAPDPDRGRIVKAYVVLAEGHEASPALAEALQEHVKQELAPYKYPRSIVFVDALPKTGSGKLQRFALRQKAQEEAAKKGENA
ncbi:benzoate-CoA ligase family protein [Aurantimonas sp. VKM B-3413]|uniref:benzoate-CoA ligase family protein n=1 Tax=Aurantimonas sp. VKM B-3413 TaxID=2779401 RepID=UPI001E534A12|nr:benzoate-CoA ligase family protein [Aurantimonas sp. VKM B-3413]MCB8840286.1 benzoate-CoA ligase family protein [Aurantimonas sp. VKM B-3413]